MLLAKAKLNTTEVFIFEVSIDSCINHDKFISVMTVVIEYNDMKEELINLKMLLNILYKNDGNMMRQL